MSMFAVCWTKSISEYGDKTKETYWSDKERGGHHAWRTKSSRNPDGSPECEFIQTRQQQLAYCKAEGLTDPADVGNVMIHKNGKDITTQGCGGTWV